MQRRPVRVNQPDAIFHAQPALSYTEVKREPFRVCRPSGVCRSAYV
jgi:hypothetical protein